MMASSPGVPSSGQRRFPCGHANHPANRFCDVCGVARQRHCPICDSPNRDDARFCGACGARFPDEGSGPSPVATPSPRRQPLVDEPAARPSTARIGVERGGVVSGVDVTPDDEPPAWSGAGRWRRDPFASPTMDEIEVAGREPAPRRRSGRLLVWVLVLVVVTAAAFVSLDQARRDWFLGQLRHGLRAVEWLAPGLSGERSSAPAIDVASGRPPDHAGPSAAGAEAADPPVGAAQPEVAAEAGTGPSAPEAVRTEQGVEAAGQALAQSPQGGRRQPSGQAPRPKTAVESARLPVRPMPSRLAPADGDPGPGTPAPSEERMAGYLIEELGRARAEETARSNAAWYDAGRAEHAFWRRVVEAIRHREGS